MKNNKNKKKKALIAGLLTVALVITGIFAFLSASDSKDNVFTSGYVDIVLREDDWYDADGKMLDDNNSNGVPDFAENVTPGKKVDKAPYIENTGLNTAWVYLCVGIPVEDESVICSGDGSYAQHGIAQPSDIIVTAYAIQEDLEGLTDSNAVWNSYVNKAGITNMFGTASSTEDTDIEIFKLIGLNEDDWNLVPVLSDYTPNASNVKTSDYYASSDGHNYYVFKYNNANGKALLEAGASTPELFTEVQLIASIGEKQLRAADEKPTQPQVVS